MLSFFGELLPENAYHLLQVNLFSEILGKNTLFLLIAVLVHGLLSLTPELVPPVIHLNHVFSLAVDPHLYLLLDDLEVIVLGFI